MSGWIAIPENSWISTRDMILGTRKGQGVLLSSYAINTSYPITLNGEVYARFEVPDWKGSGTAGLICRVDTLWSFIALYIYARDPGSGWVHPVLASFRSGQFTPLAVGEQRIALENNTCEMMLRYYSGVLYGEVRTSTTKSAVEAIAATNAFPGQVGLVKFYEAKVKVSAFEWKPFKKERENTLRDQKYKWDVFISHSSADKKKIHEIVSKMRSVGLRVWIDEEQIGLGDRVTNKIEEGLANSRTVIVCLSPALGRSNWVRAEYGAYINDEISRQIPARVIPLVIDTVEIESIPVLLRDKLRVEYNSPSDWQRLIDHLRS